MSFKKKHLNWEKLLISYEKDTSLSQYYSDILKRILLHDYNIEKQKTLLITSAIDLEGKTTTAINIALTLAKKGKKTLLVDANFKNPMAGKFFGVEDSRGLADFLTVNLEKEELIIQHAVFPNLYLLPSGHLKGDSLEIFMSKNFSSFFQKVKSIYNFMIIDTSSVNKSVEPLILGKYACGVILVILCDSTPMEEVISARDKLLDKHYEIIGVVFNKTPKYVNYLFKK